MIINPSYPDAQHTAGLLHDEIIRDDCYRMRSLLADPPQAIFDVGANIGFFAVYCRMLFPKAIIICAEPCEETLSILEQNVAHLHITTRQVALGNGQPLYLHRDPRSDGSNRCLPQPLGQPLPVTTLADFVGACPLSYAVKLDCEGAEQGILADEPSRTTLAQARHWAMEYHTTLVGRSPQSFLAELLSIDPRAVGKPTIDGRWIFWSKESA